MDKLLVCLRLLIYGIDMGLPLEIRRKDSFLRISKQDYEGRVLVRSSRRSVAIDSFWVPSVCVLLEVVPSNSVPSAPIPIATCARE